jgi:hypothetical protein
MKHRDSFATIRCNGEHSSLPHLTPPLRNPLASEQGGVKFDPEQWSNDLQKLAVGFRVGGLEALAKMAFGRQRVSRPANRGL